MFKARDAGGSAAAAISVLHAAGAASAPGAASSLEPRRWAAQAAGALSGGVRTPPEAARFKSLVLCAQVKLAEALDAAATVEPLALDEDGAPLPNALRTAVCCQAQPAGAQPPLAFDQLPWFAVAGRLRADNARLLEQQATTEAELARHQAAMATVEQQLLGFKAALDGGEAAASALTAADEQLAAARDAASAEAAAACEEARRLASINAQLREELAEARERLSSAEDLAAEEQEAWARQRAALKTQLHAEQVEREAALAQAAERLTPAEGAELEARCAQAEARLEAAEQRAAALAAANASAARAAAALTPRPDWGDAQALADECKGTAEALRRLQAQHAAALAAQARHARLLAALAAPEPAPAPWRLSLRTEAVAFFVTEGAGLDPPQQPGAGAERAQPALFAEGLGLGPDVPAFLRWEGPVPLRELGLAEARSAVAAVWRGLAAAAARGRGPCGLAAFLRHHFAAAAAAAAARASASAAPAGGAGGAPSAPASAAAAAAAERAVAEMADAAAAGYSLYHALCQHRSASASVDALWRALAGQLPAAALGQRQEVADLLRSLGAAAAAAGGQGEQDGGDWPAAQDGAAAAASVVAVECLLHQHLAAAGRASADGGGLLVPGSELPAHPGDVQRGSAGLEQLQASLRAVVAQLNLAPAICRRGEFVQQSVRGVADWSNVKRPRTGGRAAAANARHDRGGSPGDGAAARSKAKHAKASGGGRTYTSRFRGVHQTFPTRRWEAQFRRNGKPTSLGCFDKEEEAARAYDKMMLWCELHQAGGARGVTNFEHAEYEAELALLRDVSQDDLIETLRLEGRRQAMARSGAPGGSVAGGKRARGSSAGPGGGGGGAGGGGSDMSAALAGLAGLHGGPASFAAAFDAVAAAAALPGAAADGAQGLGAAAAAAAMQSAMAEALAAMAALQQSASEAAAAGLQPSTEELAVALQLGHAAGSALLPALTEAQDGAAAAAVPGGARDAAGAPPPGGDDPAAAAAAPRELPAAVAGSSNCLEAAAAGEQRAATPAPAAAAALAGTDAGGAVAAAAASFGGGGSSGGGSPGA
ncbi:hypothetical protein HT031_006017 [Scenedesmus sp. PABB004]|nr:hypothetical protein HT031_006017 [Scenedesmus sp. PABB004]